MFQEFRFPSQQSIHPNIIYANQANTSRAGEMIARTLHRPPPEPKLSRFFCRFIRAVRPHHDISADLGLEYPHLCVIHSQRRCPLSLRAPNVDALALFVLSISTSSWCDPIQFALTQPPTVSLSSQLRKCTFVAPIYPPLYCWMHRKYF